MNEFSIDPDRQSGAGVDLGIEEGKVLRVVESTGARRAVRIGRVHADALAGEDASQSRQIWAGTTADGRWYLHVASDEDEVFTTFGSLAELGRYVWRDLVWGDPKCTHVVLVLGLLRFHPEGKPDDSVDPWTT